MWGEMGWEICLMFRPCFPSSLSLPLLLLTFSFSLSHKISCQGWMNRNNEKIWQSISFSLSFNPFALLLIVSLILHLFLMLGEEEEGEKTWMTHKITFERKLETKELSHQQSLFTFFVIISIIIIPIGINCQKLWNREAYDFASFWN